MRCSKGKSIGLKSGSTFGSDAIAGSRTQLTMRGSGGGTVPSRRVVRCPVLQADLPKSLRDLQLTLGGKEGSCIFHVPSGFESVMAGSQKRLEVALSNPIVCSVPIHLALPAVDHAAAHKAARAC